MRKFSILILISIIFITNGFSQNVAINNNGAAPNTNAMLDVDVTTNDKGILIPRLSTAQRTAIAGLGAADEGLTVYDETTNSYWLWDGTQWVAFAMTGEAWQIIGNTGITASHFLGTINSADLKFRTNNIERMTIEAGGNVGIRTIAPNGALQVCGDEVRIGDAGTPLYATWDGDLFVEDIIEVGNSIYLTDRIIHHNDIDTYWDFGVDQIYIRAGDVEMLRMMEGATDYIVFNEFGNDIDFRIESDDFEHFFYIDAGTNRLGINRNNPAGVIHFVSTGEDLWLTKWTNDHNSNGAIAQFEHTNTANGNRVLMGVTNYNGSALEAAAIMGLSIDNTTTGSGGIGVIGAANNESGIAVLGRLFNDGSYSGWAGYFNADVLTLGTYWTSDKRLKKDIHGIDNALDIIKKINPVSYYWDTEKYPDIGLEANRLSYGFIAQELEEVVPEMVKDKNLFHYEGPATADMNQEMKAEEFKVVNYVLIIPILTQAIKEQQITIENLEQRIADLEEKMKKMQ